MYHFIVCGFTAVIILGCFLFPVVCVRVCAPGGEPCPAAAVAIAKAEAGDTGQREFSPDWTTDTQTQVTEGLHR